MPVGSYFLDEKGESGEVDLDYLTPMENIEKALMNVRSMKKVSPL